MPPSNFKRKWIKLWIDECLTGTIREDISSEERGVWYDFLLLAGRNRPPGFISANENTPINVRRLAALLNVSTRLLEQSIKRFEQSGRITTTLNGIIQIVNWDKYQFSDYDRQKPYRQTKHQSSADTIIGNITSVNDAKLDPALGEVVTLWESNKGLMSPFTLEELRTLYDEYPEGWLLDAIKEAIEQGKLSLAYVKAILKRWQAEGRNNKKPAPYERQEYTLD